MKLKRYRGPDFYLKCIKSYVKDDNLLRSKIDQLGLNESKVVFTLGSLIYPKEMLKNDYFADHFQGNLDKRTLAVKQFHDALYNFSIDKTQKILEDRYLIIFLEDFLEGVSR